MAGSSYSTEVAVAGVRALKLHFTEVELASCDAIVVTNGSSGPEVARVPSTSSGEVWTEWLPTSSASVTLRAEGCGQARGFRLVEAQPQWGAVHVETRGESTANPYPADGQRFQVSLGAGGYVKLTNVTVASCDEVEARALTGEVLWRWKPATAWAKAWSGRLSGDVEVGIWGQGCNATEKKGGFTLAEVRLEEAAGAPLPLGLPGQKQRPDGTWDNWHRTYMAELGHYLAPEPLQQSPAYVMSMAAGGMQTQAYAYAMNNALRYTDPTDLDAYLVTCGGYVGHTDVVVENACYGPESDPKRRG